MTTGSETAELQAEPRAAGGVGSLFLHLFLSFLFCLAMGQVVLFNWDTTYALWIGWMVFWGVVWLAFALLQVWWWSKGYEKFWRPLYPAVLLGFIIAIVFTLPLLLWPRFRRWLLTVIKPTDPPEWAESIKALARLRDDGVLTAGEFEAKKDEILRRA